ncbi:MAG: hypothetical protein EXQ58_10160 [Acidobacteria bacterium]|nr:hypothetical protein [Acidobacteriota bacterium]
MCAAPWCGASLSRSVVAPAADERVQGRHPLQTSDAVGAAQVQLGPEALALAAHLNKEMGISHQRVARALELGYGLAVNRSPLCRALLRLGQKAEPIASELSLGQTSSS